MGSEKWQKSVTHYLNCLIPHSQRAFSEDISGYQTSDGVVVVVVADVTDVVAVVVWAEVVAPRHSI